MIPEKDTQGGARLMSCVKVGKTKVAKHTNVVLSRMAMKKVVIGSVIRDGDGRKYVKKMSFRVKGFNSKGGWKVRVKEKSLHHIINGVDHAFRATNTLLKKGHD